MFSFIVFVVGFASSVFLILSGSWWQWIGVLTLMPHLVLLSHQLWCEYRRVQFIRSRKPAVQVFNAYIDQALSFDLDGMDEYFENAILHGGWTREQVEQGLRERLTTSTIKNSDHSCRYNAHSKFLRCAVKPTAESCEGCKDYDFPDALED